MELDYTLLDPAGNITALVESSVPTALQPEAALALMAAEPEAVANAAIPPSRAAILFSNTSEVGFMSLV